jgi:two-component system, chemotaxis family, sensor kinase CheA
MDDLLREFLTETTESLTQLDVELVRLEQNPNDPALIGSIFRLVHTIKGTCGFIGLPRLEHVAHAGENVLGKFRDGILPVTPKAVTLILKSIDTIKFIIGELEEKQTEPEGHDEELIAELNAMAAGQANVAASAQPVTAPAAEPLTVVSAQPDEFGFVPVAAGDISTLEANMGMAPSPAPTASAIAPVNPTKSEAKPAGDEHATKESSIASQSIRVGVDLLENLMTIVSELVLTRNQLLQVLRGQKDSTFSLPLQRLNQVTSELQEGVMKTRMQPIGNAWSKLPRIVRDLSVELGKKIDLQMIGAETELDRQVLELIKDPLTHMVRNSGDHGIELPADRLNVGKPETGTIVLNAYHEGGHIIIEIVDDGRGLALDKIKSKAVQNGLATEADLALMSDQQIMQFIFKPGFSTAAKVTSVSGRGVGMDVVKTNIEKIGGTVDLQSTLGKGSRFLIKIPLTLAIVSALIVECAGNRFAIPQIGIIELVQASAGSDHRIELIKNTPVLRLRDRLLPLISLRQALRLGNDEIKPDGDSCIVVVQVGNATSGIIVDQVHDIEEIVVKPTSPILRNISMFSGNTILGDGSVVMILDLNGFAGQSSEVDVVAASAKKKLANQVTRSDGQQSLLLFSVGDDAPRAVPLSLVARLEKVDCKSVEYSNDAPMIQYRGKLMPLVPLVTTERIPKEGQQSIVVFSDRDHSMGLIVDEIIDIVDERIHIDLTAKRPGYLGTSIISGKATDIVDAAYYLGQVCNDWFGVTTDGAYGVESRRRVLLVDDSAFFRNLLTPLLTVAGYEVTAVEKPAEAFKLQEAGEDFDAIISDIEMPDMNGFDFAQAVHRSGRWMNVPMLALSSHATPRDLDRSRQVGFVDHVAKFNRDALLASLQHILGHSAAVRDASQTGISA